MWLALAFLSAFLLGCYEVNKKMSLNGNAVIPVLFFNTLISSLIFVPFILLSFYTDCLDGDGVCTPCLFGGPSEGIDKGGDRLILLDIGVFCLETFAADDNRADQGQPARAYITGCDASVRGTTESISMGRSLAFYRFLLSPFLIGEERGDSFCP
mgnify:CR=1 FL=1